MDIGKRKKSADSSGCVPRAPQITLDFIENCENKFDELTRDLMAEEPGIANARLHGQPRQTQIGIGVYAERTDESELEVASCKFCREVSN